jgi:hypothetical protein
MSVVVFHRVCRAALKSCKSKTASAASLSSFSTDAKANSIFYEVSKLDTLKGSVIGELTSDATVNLKNTRPGDVVRIPYEMTITPSFRDFWHGTFFSNDRINTSTPFARALGLQDQVVPFSMMVFLCGSMSHAYDAADIETGYKNARYHWPAFSGDTFTKVFKVKSVRNTSDKKKSLFAVECQLFNQRDKPIFSLEKTMIFPFVVPESTLEVPSSSFELDDAFLHHLVEQADTIHTLGSQTLNQVKPGQLILHTMQRPMTFGGMMQLSTIARLNHDRHFNSRKYSNKELVIPGGLLSAMTLSMSSRGR